MRDYITKLEMVSEKPKGDEQMEVREVEINVTDANFKQEVLESDIPVLVDFWAQWCGPCHMIAPAVKAIAGEYKEKLKVCKVNVDEAPAAASEYSIMSIPTVAIFKNGKIVDKVIGVVPKAQLEAVIKPHI